MKMIKWLFGLYMMVLVIGISGITVQAKDIDTDASNFKWAENSDGTITITKYAGTDETVVIPSEIDNKKVKSIGESAFNNCKIIKHLIISEGVVAIDNNSFENCYNLETINIPNTIQTIGKYGFAYCTTLKTIDFPKNLTSIGEYAFNNCSSLEEIDLPEGLTSIGKYAFRDCRGLKSIDLPNSLINIGENAFSGCNSISKVIIPQNVDSVKRYNFFQCKNLQEVVIQNGVQRIENRAFMGCNNLKKVIIPNSVTYIDETSFTALYDTYYENSPKQLTIYADPNSYARTYANKMGIKFSCMNTHDWDSGVTTIEATATSDGEKICTCTACGTKKTETVPKSRLPKKGNTVATPNSKDTYKVTKPATQNGTVEFSKMDKAKSSITIPDTITVDGITYKVTSISKNAFKNNKKLKKVTIGKNITTIGANAFYGCKNLKTITIKSKNLKTVSKNAFKGINSKAKIKVPKSKLTKYKKLLKGKGQKSTVKITK